MTDKLAREIATFEKHKPELEKTHAGKYVLIKGDSNFFRTRSQRSGAEASTGLPELQPGDFT